MITPVTHSFTIGDRFTATFSLTPDSEKRVVKITIATSDSPEIQVEVSRWDLFILESMLVAIRNKMEREPSPKAPFTGPGYHPVADE